MRSHRPLILVLSLILPLFADLSARAAGSAGPSTQEDLTRAVNSFYGAVGLDEASARVVENVTITKDVATFTLKSGTLYPGKPVEGLVVTAVFVGEAEAVIEPTRPMDKDCLNRAASDHLRKVPGGKIRTAFSEMVIVSLDDTLAGLLGKLPAGPGADAARASELLKDRLAQLKGREEDQAQAQKPMDISLVEKLTGAVPNGPLIVQLKSADYDWLQFVYDDLATYELRLSAFEKVGAFSEERPLIVTHKSSDLDPAGNVVADALKDQKDQIDIQKYVMDITIPDTQHFLVEADVHFVTLNDGLRSVRFDLINQISGRKADSKAKTLKLVKVTDASGKELPFVHRKNNALVLLPEPLAKGSDSKLHFSLDEETIIQLSSVHYLVLNTYAWFPQHGYLGGRAAIDWTIRTKKPLAATGSGRRVREEVDGAYNVTQLVFDTDVVFPSLLFGQYQKATDTYTPATPDGKQVELAVYWWPNTDFFVMDADPPQSVSITVPSGKSKSVLAEAKEILKFGESLYGPFPYSSLNIAQMSPGLGFGQAPPGLVQLTGEAFMSSAQLASIDIEGGTINADFFHEFFSHEIGHQWWGHVIAWAADEDVWLSESFAEYTAGLYVMGLLGQDRFQGKLKEWKDGARLADSAAPIAWANNLSGVNANQWRTNLLYQKGPYVVHMLRMQVGHENFVKAMKNLTSKHRFKPVTTTTLQQEFEAVTGYKLDFFFNQWFRGTGIPTFDYSTDVKQSEDGKWVATVKINQRDKANPKVVSMPVFFHFGKDKVVVKERPILKAEDVYQIKLPEKPQRITLDDYRTLLADIVAQDPAAH